VADALNLYVDSQPRVVADAEGTPLFTCVGNRAIARRPVVISQAIRPPICPRQQRPAWSAAPTQASARSIGTGQAAKTPTVVTDLDLR